MQDYSDHLAATGIADSSLKRYRRIIQNFVDFIWYKKKYIKRLSDVKTKDIWDYIHYRKQDEISDKTISNEIAELKKCFRYANDVSAIGNNPIKAIRFKNHQETTPHFFAKEEIKAIFKALPTEGIREIFRTLLYTGMRTGELMHLQWKDVDLDRRLIHIRYQIIQNVD